jgi:antirestriction protein ArdC
MIERNGTPAKKYSNQRPPEMVSQGVPTARAAGPNPVERIDGVPDGVGGEEGDEQPLGRHGAADSGTVTSAGMR